VTVKETTAMRDGRLRFTLLWLFVACVFASLGCSARRSEPIAGPLPITSDEIAHGRDVFMAKCHQCHPGGDAGLGPALNNKPLPKSLIRLQVRQGFGAMPAFSEKDITDEELEHLLVYLKKLRAHG
jgi:mono/diheme cytochrome c family protein